MKHLQAFKEDFIMATLRITGVQMNVKPSKGENLPRILNLIERSDADVVVFPKMSLTGYNNDFSDTRTTEAWRQIAAACRQHYRAAVVGTGARNEGHAYIQSRIYGDEGELVGTYEKLVPTEPERQWARPGDELRTFDLKGVTVGCLICNDLWVAPGSGPYHDPRLSLQLGQRGVQVIFHQARTGSDSEYGAYFDSNIRLRAKESGCYIVSVNTASNNGPLNAASGVVSPEGEWIAQCPRTGEQTFTCDIELPD